MFPERDVQLLGCKEDETVKIVDGSACEVIDIGTVNVTGRDRTVRALEAVRYISEARYNLISIRVLDLEGCQIQVNTRRQDNPEMKEV